MYFNCKNLIRRFILFSAILVSSGILASNALAFSYETSTVELEDSDEFNSGAGELDLKLDYDSSTEILEMDLVFHNNSFGHSANFFFITLTDGAMPGDEAESVIFFDASENRTTPVISVYEYEEYDGSSEPLINAASGDLIYSSQVGDAANPVLLSNIERNDDSSRYQLTLDSSILPGASFGSTVGIWLQSMGLFGEYGTYSDYNSEDGSFTQLLANINSPGGYGWLDIENMTAVGADASEVPEPTTLALLTLSLIGLVLKRRNIK